MSYQQQTSDANENELPKPYFKDIETSSHPHRTPLLEQAPYNTLPHGLARICSNRRAPAAKGRPSSCSAARAAIRAAARTAVARTAVARCVACVDNVGRGRDAAQAAGYRGGSGAVRVGARVGLACVRRDGRSAPLCADAGPCAAADARALSHALAARYAADGVCESLRSGGKKFACGGRIVRVQSPEFVGYVCGVIFKEGHAVYGPSKGDERPTYRVDAVTSTMDWRCGDRSEELYEGP